MNTNESLRNLMSDSHAKGEVYIEQPIVAIVDDDVSIREALYELILSSGMRPMVFSSTHELLNSDILDTPGCLILDVRMPGVNGLELQRQLAQRGNVKPIIFLTGYGDIPMTVEAMKAGVVDFLTKPVREQTLLDAISEAIKLDEQRRHREKIVNHNIECYSALTPRERDVFREVVRGRLNKQIAYDLGISEVTVKLHRGNVMRKMEASTIGELIRSWETLRSRLNILKSMD